MHDLANNRRFFSVNIEPWRQDNELRATLQRHEGWHGGLNAEGARFVVAGSKYATLVARTAHAYWFAAQRRSIPHLDRGVEAIHVEMDDCAGRLNHRLISMGMTRGSRWPAAERLRERRSER